jgi:flavorubredoxin
MHTSIVMVLILYESRRGYTLTVARAIRDELRSRGVESAAAPIRDVDAGTIAAADAFVVGSWVTGKIVVGVGPARGALEGIAGLPDLGRRPAAVFCTYDVAPRATLTTLASRLIGRGADVVAGERFRAGFASRRRRSLADAPAFVDEILPLFETVWARSGPMTEGRRRG